MSAGQTGRIIALLLAGLAMVLATVWGALALYYLGPGPEVFRTTLGGGFAATGLAVLLAILFQTQRRRALAGFILLFILPLLAWFSAKPSNNRDWQPEVAVLPYADINGNLVTFHNIRNFDYRTETDFTPAYIDRTFDLQKLDRVDLVASYWMGPAIAHLFLTFGFGSGQHLAISIEVRNSRSRPYGTLPGIFRQYELVYVVAEERDAIRVRTNYRKKPEEQVYLFRIIAPAENVRRVFMDYVRQINDLREHPRFYNTLTTNCTTLILAHSAVNPDHIGYSWKILLSGYAPEYVYEQGRLDQSLSFQELQMKSHINAAAQAADQAADFSRLIRMGLP